MNTPLILAQISDPHIGAVWADGDPVVGLQRAVNSLLALQPKPNALLISGDLADNATDAEYELVHELLAPLQAHVYVLPGNHDDRHALHHHFDVPGANGEPVQYSVDLGPVRLVVLDTMRPGEARGELDADRLAWLDAELTKAPEVTTLLAMHHPPLATGIPAEDELGLPPADRHALGDIVRAHQHVRRIVAGHLHRVLTAELAGCGVLTVPSTYVQARVNLGSHELEFTTEPAGFAVHTLVDGDLVSHVQPVDQTLAGGLDRGV